MLSKQERNYLMFEKEFKERYGEKYCKKIRNSIRKKIIQMGIDLFLIDKFERKWWNKNLERRKSLRGYIITFLGYFIKEGEKALTKKREKERELEMLKGIGYSIYGNKYEPKQFIADTYTIKMLEKAILQK